MQANHPYINKDDCYFLLKLIFTLFNDLYLIK
ncbi:hypothetical protein Cri9333_2858 [Crinalium epipsammum PCC 9333]|uniref:Uncharacterized protein n=1 Tax=Crinalium epipsammum PCC 9333 TaxID=1173022 RepID=K9W2P7_9CYAN|nr:hypothetical protein Cri9333_2858 [Crinalium epipsammum PCC 9333]